MSLSFHGKSENEAPAPVPTCGVGIPPAEPIQQAPPSHGDGESSHPCGAHSSVRNNGTEHLEMLCVQYRGNTFTAEDAADGNILDEPVKWRTTGVVILFESGGYALRLEVRNGKTEIS